MLANNKRQYTLQYGSVTLSNFCPTLSTECGLLFCRNSPTHPMKGETRDVRYFTSLRKCDTFAPVFLISVILGFPVFLELLREAEIKKMCDQRPMTNSFLSALWVFDHSSISTFQHPSNYLYKAEIASSEFSRFLLLRSASNDWRS